MPDMTVHTPVHDAVLAYRKGAATGDPDLRAQALSGLRKFASADDAETLTSLLVAEAAAVHVGDTPAALLTIRRQVKEILGRYRDEHAASIRVAIREHTRYQPVPTGFDIAAAQVCTEDGCLVWDTAAHNDWHAKQEGRES